MRFLFSLLSLVAVSTVASADSSEFGSLKAEREQFPDVLETITGKWPRHSLEFDEWQIKNRQARLGTDPNNPALINDLGLAFARAGEYAKAVSTLEGKETQPRSRDAEASLGFVYFLRGDYPKALPPLERALAADADAYAGRDKYFRWLVEYLAEKPSRRLPYAPVDSNAPWPHRPRSFATFLHAKLNKDDLDLADAQAAVRALLQIVRMGGRESELVLEALGDLLCYSSDPGKPVAKRLAARAYLRAGYVRDNPGIRNGYIALAEWAIVHQQRDRDDYKDQKEAMTLLTRLFAETGEASAWRTDFQAKENDLIANNPDPEGEISRLSSEVPRVSDDPSDSLFASNQADLGRYVAFGALGLVVLIAGFVLISRIARRKNPTAE